MSSTNYTSIQHLVDTYLEEKKKKEQSYFSGSSPEAGPISEKGEIVVPSESAETAEDEVDEEVAPYVEIKKEDITLHPDLINAGLQVIHPTSSGYQNITLPISDDKVLSGLHAPITSSVRWLSTFAMVMLKRAHLSLRKIHGRVVRVVQR